MEGLKLTEVEEELIKKYQNSKDSEIALYFFNKLGKDLLAVVYSKVNQKFTTIPLEKEDLMSIVWKTIKEGLKEYKISNQNLWQFLQNKSYYASVREIQKYFKNTELVLNYADSWDHYSQTHCIYKTAKNAIVEYSVSDVADMVKPIVECVKRHNDTYTKTQLKQLLFLKSLGYSEREIAQKMHVSRRYVTSMFNVIITISRRYLKR